MTKKSLIKEWRLENNMSQMELAEKLKLSQSKISRAENGVEKSFYRVINKMKEVMGVDLLKLNNRDERLSNEIKKQQSHIIELCEVCEHAVEHKQEVFLNKKILVSVNFKIV